MNKAPAVTIALLVGVGLGVVVAGGRPPNKAHADVGVSRSEGPSGTRVVSQPVEPDALPGATEQPHRPATASPVRTKILMNGPLGAEVSWQCDVTNNESTDRVVFLEVKFKDTEGFEQDRDVESRMVAAGMTVTYTGRVSARGTPIDLEKTEAVID